MKHQRAFIEIATRLTKTVPLVKTARWVTRFDAEADGCETSRSSRFDTPKEKFPAEPLATMIAMHPKTQLWRYFVNEAVSRIGDIEERQPRDTSHFFGLVENGETEVTGSWPLGEVAIQLPFRTNILAREADSHPIHVLERATFENRSIGCGELTCSHSSKLHLGNEKPSSVHSDTECSHGPGNIGL